MGLFDTASAALADLERRVSALEGTAVAVDFNLFEAVTNAEPGATITVPAGRWEIGSELFLKSGVTVQGVGDASEVYKPNVPGEGHFVTYNVTEPAIRKLKLSSDWDNANGGAKGIRVWGPTTGLQISEVLFSGLMGGVNIERGNGASLSSGLVISDCRFYHCGVPLSMQFVRDSQFLRSTMTDTWFYAAYVEKACNGLLFDGLTDTRSATNDEAWCLCMYSEDDGGYAAADYPCAGLVYLNVNTTGAHPGVRVNPHYQALIDGFYGRSGVDFNGDAWFNVMPGGQLTLRNYGVDTTHPTLIGTVLP